MKPNPWVLVGFGLMFIGAFIAILFLPDMLNPQTPAQQEVVTGEDETE